MKLIKFFLVIITLFVVEGCSDSYKDSKKKRQEMARSSQSDIYISVVWALEDNGLLKGIQLAKKEINAGGVKVKFKGENGQEKFESRQITIYEQNSSIKSIMSPLKLRQGTRVLSRSIAVLPEVVAVIGHRSSSVAIPASITYQYHGIVFFPPASTSILLLSHNFDYVFRTMPNNAEMGKKMANYCANMGYKSVVILNDRSAYGEELADSFLKSANQKKIHLVFRRSFSPKRNDFTQIVSELKKKDFNAIFLSTGSTTGGEFIKQSRRMGVKGIIIGGDALESPKTWKIAGKNAQGLIVPTVFNKSTRSMEKFIEKFKKEYKKEEPDKWAALGYDILYLLVHAMEKAQSAVPIEFATHLRYMSPWTGVTGNYQFKQNGELEGKKLHLKVLCNGKFENIEEKFELENEGEINTQGYPIFKPHQKKCVEQFKNDYNFDKDEDGVHYKEDKCPNNTSKEISKGVELENPEKKGCPKDYDEDGIPDYRDNCPRSTQLTIQKGVDSVGCPKDVDKDGLLDYKDSCLSTPLGVAINENGCAIKDKPNIIILGNNSFAPNQFELTPEIWSTLDKLIDELKNQIGFNHIESIELVGHSDSKEEAKSKKNQGLSKKRANSVAQYLINQGISNDKITISGQGSSQSFVSNKVEKGRAQNRRVVITITSYKIKKLNTKKSQLVEK
ncbi:ABC transporter substrate-binding protein [Candidatus Parabeggiatoa sp. HSG14]|uniref:ABC transporter substrate-binding protein n=1 Tax=Candidatus Parabeggiatoa sp. HSG14 TaxID=3055593 RepID=UPI0025A8A18C|nr:ABC transporter substrate-binding protein [Thiotrichales bacterium HSG14]